MKSYERGGGRDEKGGVRVRRGERGENLLGSFQFGAVLRPRKMLIKREFFGVLQNHAVGHWIDAFGIVLHQKLITIYFRGDQGDTEPNHGTFFSVRATMCTILSLENVTRVSSEW